MNRFSSRRQRLDTSFLAPRLRGALRLAHFFGTSAEFWLNLQKLYELRIAEQKTGATIRSLPRLAGRLKGQNRGPHARAA